MRRAETIKAKVDKRSSVTLCEADSLLGVNDEARQGALRFSLELDEPVFLAAKDQNSVPPLISLPKLLSATERFLDDDEYNIVKWKAVALSLAKIAFHIGDIMEAYSV